MKSRRAGYTIIEVLIVLAVTGGLMMAAILLLSGKQATTELNQAVRDMEAKIQTVASDVANGFYPSGFKCTADNTGGSPQIYTTSNNAGENVGCIFIGKVINFNSDTNNGIKILTLVGRRTVGDVASANVTKLAQAKPTAVASNPDVTVSYAYPYSMTVKKLVGISDGTAYSSFGFLTYLGDGGASSPTGSRSTLLYGLTGAAPNGDTASDTAGKIVSPGLVEIPDGLRLCLEGGNGVKAEITIGESGSQTSTNVLVGSGVSNVCA